MTTITNFKKELSRQHGKSFGDALDNEIMELKDRELAIRWWCRRTPKEQRELGDEHLKVHRDNLESITGSEAEWIWKAQQPL